MEISRKELLDAYGIDLTKGLYTIENVNGVYKINTLKDDTSGCILVGTAFKDNILLHSKVALTKLLEEYIKPAIKRGEEITIKVINPIKIIETVKPTIATIVKDSIVKSLPKVELVLQPENKTNIFQSIKQFIQWLTKIFYRN